MKKMVEREVDVCDFCEEQVNPRNKCDWCSKLCCHKHGRLVTVRDYNTHEPTSCATRWVCIDCAKTVYKKVLDAEYEIDELESRLRELKEFSHAKMAQILHDTIEHHRNDKDW